MVRWVNRWTENNGKYFAEGILLIIFSQILLCSVLHASTWNTAEVRRPSLDLEIPPEVGKEGKHYNNLKMKQTRRGIIYWLSAEPPEKTKKKIKKNPSTNIYSGNQT